MRPTLVYPIIDLRLVSIMIVSLSFPLGSNFVDDASSIDLGKAFDPLLTFLLFVASFLF